MPFSLKILLYNAILFFLIIKEIAGESIQNGSNYTLYPTNYTLDFIKKMKIKGSIQSISDCSVGALKCKNDNNINGENNIHCFYPDYICTNPNTCYILQKIDNENNTTCTIIETNQDIPSLYPDNNTSSVLGEKNDDYQQKLVMKSDIASSDSIQYEQEDRVLMNKNCTNSDQDCLSNCCDSDQCQTDFESSLYYCNVESTNYKCREIANEGCVNTNTINGNNINNCILPLTSSQPSLINDLKYVLISVGTLLTIIFLAFGLYIFNKKSKPLEESNLNSFTIIIP